MTFIEIIAVLGFATGVTGTVLGILNYLRDRGRVEITLQWDMETFGNTEYDPSKKWGMITMTNAGRRTVYVSHVALRVPKGYDASHLIIQSGLAGKSLPEGSAAEIHVVSQDGLEKYAKSWRDIVAQVSDSTGRVWTSKRVPKSKVPSWAEGKGAV